MAGYGVKERSIKSEKPRANVCGSCGGYADRNLCQACSDEVFFAGVCAQVENEKSESGESQ